ncbi:MULTISPECIES: VirD4-like conjugal transfer protein, CD1115 family [Flavonifractor]|uniref:VirD4-like conjugal transfer protein, CD1115 family n=1 Tax=Flavonifractor TaxID=946234 RepID=UPI001FA91B74|nr:MULTISPECIES: type IV secretory system conjugative DNA transfer family protein [Flavonifractor]
MPELLTNLTAALQHPLDIHWTDKSLLSILICTGLYIMGLCIYASEQRRTRDGEEHGSAAWGSPRQVNAMFRQKENKILTRHVRLGLDTHKHRRSLNVLVIGGSGAAKTRSYVKPNILEANTNYVITDPKMEVLTATGGWLKSKGYDIRVLNLVNLEQSDGYNPFHYLRDEKDALKLVNNLIQATTPKGSHESDPFWTKAETALLQAIILMLFQEAPEYEQNFSMVMRVLEYAEVREEDDEYISPLDLLFQAIERENPESVALRQYKVFKQSAGKTAKSILVSAAVRLAPFNLPQIRAITDHDDMDLYTLGEKKCALYAVIPDNDNTFNFLVSLLYSQAFQTLYYSADQIHHGALPQHVHFVLDEFAAMPLPGFTRELATMRSRNISASTIIQNMAQIKELYKDSWETIPGNSDSILYLGGNEQSTHKYISESLGKATIDTKTHGQTKGKSGSYSTNFQMSGRELLTPDEVRALDNRYCILFIRGAKPIMDLKYELTEHPAIRHTVDGGGAPYIHHGHHTTPAIPGTPFFQVISADETNKEKEIAE